MRIEEPERAIESCFLSDRSSRSDLLLNTSFWLQGLAMIGICMAFMNASGPLWRHVATSL